ncbi:dicarboxylate/amino acid:cation symporter [Moorella sulfitireducens]|uniref:dicarboxylate/amino acid:cation symporter n=1 Tax=Neomoorella sulfitireducens TaxID=2972948 RepID=UPI0021ACFF26
MKLPQKLAIGFILGIVAGLIFQFAGWNAKVLQPFGDLFIRLIRMVVVPLVVSSLIAGAAGMSDATKFGRVAVKILVYYFFTTAVAVTLGLIVANIVHPGLGVNLSTTGLKAQNVTPPSMVQTLLNIVPINPVESMAKGDLLPMIFFAIIFGFALSSLGEAGQPVLKFFEIVMNVMIKVTGYVMEYAPFGIFALITVTVGVYGIGVLLPLIKLIIVMYVVALLHILIVYTPFITLAGKMWPGTFFRVVAEPLLVAFTTCSSAAALPLNMRSVERLGVPKSISSFTIPLGNTINMDGAAIYLGIAAVFISEVFGMPLGLNQQLTIILMAILASIGSVGVPGAALIVMTMVFQAVGLPIEGIALVAGVDRILDMARTPLNILGDATGALVVAKSEGELVKSETDMAV